MKCSQSEPKYDDAYFSKLEKDYEHLKGAHMPCCYSEDELRRDLLPTKEIDKFNETTLEAIEEARTEEAAGTIDTSSYDAFVNSISKKCGLDEALDDVKAGRVYQAKNVDDFFRKMGM